MSVVAAMERMAFLLDTVPARVRTMDDARFLAPRAAGKWSPLQILGHLVDSAANNHQRIIRARYVDRPEISYDQVAWNALSHYQDADRESVLSLWVAYNRHLLHLMSHLTPEDLGRTYRVNEDVHDLEHLVLDYVDHMEHHLRQFVEL